MRWNSLFEDLEAQLDASVRAAEEAEIADRVRSEQAGISLIERLRGQIGLILRVRVSGGALFDGELTHVGSEWTVLSKNTGEVVIPIQAVKLLEGLSRNVAPALSPVQSRLGLASALRTLARDRAAVVVHLVDGGRIEGVIDRVGRDFLEVASVLPGEQRRAGNVGAVHAVPFSGLAAVASLN